MPVGNQIFIVRERLDTYIQIHKRIQEETIIAKTKRKDKSRVVLRVGELQRSNGTYQYSWLDSNKKVHYVYAKTLDDLCEKEAQIAKDKGDGIKSEARYTTVKDLFDL